MSETAPATTSCSSATAAIAPSRPRSTRHGRRHHCRRGGHLRRDLTIDKALTIVGANAGLAGTDARGAETVLSLGGGQRRLGHDDGFGRHRRAEVRGTHVTGNTGRERQPDVHQQRVRADSGGNGSNNFYLPSPSRSPSRTICWTRRAIPARVPAGRRSRRSLALDGHLHRQHLQRRRRDLRSRRRQQRPADPQSQQRQR